MYRLIDVKGIVMQKYFVFLLRALMVFSVSFVSFISGILIYAFFNEQISFVTFFIVSMIMAFLLILMILLRKYYGRMMENFFVSGDTIQFTGYKRSMKKTIFECKRIVVNKNRGQCCFFFKDNFKVICQYKYFPFQRDELNYNLISNERFSKVTITIK